MAERNTRYAQHFADSVGLFSAQPELDEDSAQGQAAREAAGLYLNEHARLEFNIPGVTFGGRYDGSPLIVGDGSTAPPDAANTYQPTACPGGRPPHVWLDDGRSLFDLFHSEWTLLVLGQASVDTAQFAGAAADLGLDLKVVQVSQAAVRQAYEAPLVLIRPDQIVAWRGDTDAKARAVLRQVVGFVQE
jgi:hypothetical protein